MQEKMIVGLLQVMLSFMLLFFPLSSQGTIAYIPQTLRECINVAHEVAASSSDTKNLQELHAMIQENRILASDDMTRKAIKEAFYAIKAHKNEFKNEKQHRAILKYFVEYLNSLNDVSLLLAIQGESARSASWPMSLVARCLPAYSVGMDMMHLSSELASMNNIPLCGSGKINFPADLNTRIIANVLKSWHLNAPKDPSVIFNANTMTSVSSINPTVVFGTGVSSPSINAWAMSPSASVQSPINLQFSIPSDLQTQEEVSLELHFLVKQQGALAGKARIQVEAKYIHNHADFDVLSPVPTFTYKNYSTNILITEPGSVDSVRHVSIVIPLDSSVIKNLDFASLSLIRVEPVTSVEYSQDIYLASAAFRYTRINF